MGLGVPAPRPIISAVLHCPRNVRGQLNCKPGNLTRKEASPNKPQMTSEVFRLNPTFVSVSSRPLSGLGRARQGVNPAKGDLMIFACVLVICVTVIVVALIVAETLSEIFGK